MSAIQNIRSKFQSGQNDVVKPTDTKKGLNKSSPYPSIVPYQFQRIRVDITLWRAAINEAEWPYFPYRVRMQQIFQDTILNEHVDACMKRRKNLTLLRPFKICDDGGNADEAATKYFKSQWFRLFQSYCLDALFYGYNLVSLGDMVDSKFPNLSFVRRQNISPERMNVTRFPYMPWGVKFTEDPFTDWYVWVPTPTATGQSNCGYGLLYTIAKTEILLRNNTSQNADYNELWAQPWRVGKSSKVGEQRTEFEELLKNMGSNAWALMDMDDEIELKESGGSGRAFETYKDFEKRNEAKISKMILGHADALDSTPGKLGGGQDGDESPSGKALKSIQSEDAEFMENIINNELIPRLLKLGISQIPLGKHFEYLNDEEKEEQRQREDDSNKKTADLMKGIKDAGGKLTEETWEWFEERTGIPGVEFQEEFPPLFGNGFGQDKKLTDEKGDPIKPGDDPKKAGTDPKDKGKKPFPAPSKNGKPNGENRTMAIKKQVQNMTSEEKIKLNGKAKFIS